VRSGWGRVAAGLVVVAGSLVAIGVAPAGATSLVHNEMEFRNAWTNNSETEIDLANDITFTTPCASPGTALRNSTTALTVNGNGHTLTLCTNTGVGVLEQHPSTGALTFQNITVQGGTASGVGVGGALYSDGAVTVTNSTFTNNNIPGGGDGGAIFSQGAVTVTNSTFTNNTAGVGGAFSANGAVTVTNSTFSTNTAVLGGGGAFNAGSVSVPVTVAYSTLTGNVAPAGGSAVSAFGFVTLFGSVFVKPAGTGNLCAGGAIPSSSGYNYANETANSCHLTATGDSSLDANDPLLGALANNGGPTQTRLPQDGPSPLIDAIPNAHCGDGNSLAGFTITTDQRGLPRPDTGSPNCDIGAVEVQPTAPTTLVVTAAFTG